MLESIKTFVTNLLAWVYRTADNKQDHLSSASDYDWVDDI
jgi:hypothetical protein